MNILFLDTETTGLPLWKEPSDHRARPDCEAAARIYFKLKDMEKDQ